MRIETDYITSNNIVISISSKDSTTATPPARACVKNQRSENRTQWKKCAKYERIEREEMLRDEKLKAI